MIEEEIRLQGELGAALILAIAFLVVVGGIGAAVLAAVTSGFNDRTTLDQARNREYAADGAVEYSIAQVRGLATPGVTPCGALSSGVYTISPAAPALNGVTIRVDCINAPAVAVGATGDLVEQDDVIFAACANTGIACSDANKNVIVRAQVNYQGAGSPSQVTTYVLSWSVNA